MIRDTTVSKIKIMVISTELDFGGVETSILDRALALRELDYDFDLEFACLRKLGNIGQELQSHGFSVHDLKSSPKIENFLTSLRLWSLVRKRKPDLIHTLSIEANFHGLIAARLAGRIPILAEEVGAPLNSVGEPTRSWRARMLGKWIWNHVDHILAVSDATMRYLVNHERAPASKISIIRHFVDLKIFAFTANKNTAATVDDKFIVGSVGRLSPEKGQKILLKAISEIAPSDRNNIEVWIVGEGTDKRELNQLVARLGITEKVKFLGLRRDIPDLLRKMNIFVLPSFQEALGIAVLEAMAVGTPVIASNVGGVSEIIEHGKTGALVPAGDVKELSAEIIEFVRRADNERQLMILKARSFVEKYFSSEEVIKELSNLYLSLRFKLKP